jgi:hypothetical protein
MFSHDYAKWSHSRKRYFERYGEDIEEKNLAKIKEIVKGSVPTRGLNYYEVYFEEKLLKLIYEPGDKEITTFLPKEYKPKIEEINFLLKEKVKNKESIYNLPNQLKLKLFIKAKNAKTKNIFFWGSAFEVEKILKYIEEPEIEKMYNLYKS